MKTSENTADLFKAFVAAQSELKNAVFDKVNPHFKSKYATLAGMRDGITPVLSKNGLAVIQGTWCEGQDAAVYTRLVHTSGQWIESRYPFQIDKPQQMGSSFTYARRYGLAAITGIASEEDDDGNAAQTTPKATPPVMIASTGTQGASKAPSRAPYEAMVKEIRNATGVKALQDWYAHSFAEIEKLPPDFIDELRIEYSDRLSELKKALAA